MVRLRLLGGAAIEGPGGPLEGRIGQRRQLALLAFLALHDRPVSRDKVVAVFWPDTTDAKARHSLSDALYVIRRELGDGVVRTIGDDLVLDPARIACDAAEFRAAVLTGADEKAAGLYGGPLMDGFHLGGAVEFDPWLDLERADLAATCRAVLERLATSSDGSGAVQWWRRAVSIEPHNSRLVHGLASALARAGDRAGALQALAAHSDAIEREFGLPPGDEIRALDEALRRTVHRAAPGERPGTAPGPADPRPGPRRSRRSAAVAATVACLVLLVAAAWLVQGDGVVPDADVVAVLPFRAAGLDGELAHLRQGMVELLGGRLSGEVGALRAVPAGDVLAAWRESAPDDPELTRAGALRLTRRLGAGLLLEGALVGGHEALSVQTRLVDLDGRIVAHAGVTGPADGLPHMIDRLVAELLGRRAGVEEHRLDRIASLSRPALGAYLEAFTAHRRGDYSVALREYDRALLHDSTFALAGIGAIHVAGWVGGSAPVAARGRRAAVRNIARLSERDRVGLTGRLVTERSEPVTGWLQLREREEALRRFRDHALLWYLRGDLLLHNGRALPFVNPYEEARRSFERAIALDPDYAEPVHHLAATLTALGDTAALRRLAANQLARQPTGAVPDYLRWNAFHVLGDASFRPPPLDSMDVDATLRWIGIVAQDWGFAVEDGARAVRLRLAHTGIRDEVRERRRGAFAWALNQGRPRAAIDALESLRAVQPDPDYGLRLAVLSALWADGDPAHADSAAASLAASPATGRVHELNECIVAQWRLHVEPGDVPRPRILSSAEAVSADAGPWAVPIRVCSLVRDALWLRREGDTAWRAAIGRLDSLLAMAPILGLIDDGQEEYVHLALGRMYEEAGDPHAALRAIDRRARYNGWQPFLASSLRDEGRLAATTGDTARAIRAWRHFLAFRADPEARLRADRDRWQAELGAMTGGAK